MVTIQRRHFRRLACLPWFLLLAQPGLGAQEVIDLSRISPCNCRLEHEVLTRLGERDGNGSIESDIIFLSWNESTGLYAAAPRTGDHIVLFDRRGTFLRRASRFGFGPGELSNLLGIGWVGSDLVAMDALGPVSQIVVLSAEGSLRREVLPQMRIGEFLVFSDSTIITGIMDRNSRDAVGFPLHEISFNSGKVIRHFGSVDGDFSLHRPGGFGVLLGKSLDPGSVWRRVGVGPLDEWSTGTVPHLTRSVIGLDQWYGIDRSESDDTLANSEVFDFGIDHEGRLWIVTEPLKQEGMTWDDVATNASGEALIFIDDKATYWRSQLDVFDLEAMKHLGSISFDEPNLSLVRVGDELRLSRVVLDPDTTLRVHVERVITGH